MSPGRVFHGVRCFASQTGQLLRRYLGELLHGFDGHVPESPGEVQVLGQLAGLLHFAVVVVETGLGGDRLVHSAED